jgi:hypothetical protein
MLYEIPHIHNKKPLVVVEDSFFIFFYIIKCSASTNERLSQRNLLQLLILVAGEGVLSVHMPELGT